MKDFLGNELKLGDRVVTTKIGTSSFIAGEVRKLTPAGAKIATDVVMKDGEVWRRSELLQREYRVIHLIEHNPEREEQLKHPLKDI